jgi:uncharacterized RDD family membrane protein YckC
MAEPRVEGWTYLLRHAGGETSVSDGDVVLGRSHSAGVRIDEETVSRSHALLSLREGRAVVRDLGSSNGLFVNGRKVAGQAPVADGDTIGLGTAMVVLSIVAPPDADLRTAMIATIPAGSEPARPSQTVTSFMTTSPAPAAVEAAPVPAPAPKPKRRARSFDEVLIRGEEEAPEMEARIAAFDPAPIGARVLSAFLDLAVAAGIAFVCCVPAVIAIVTHSSLRERSGGGTAFWALVGFCALAGIGGIVVYFLSGWCGRGATAGQRAAGIRLVSEAGALVTGGRAFLRLVALLLYFATAGLLALTVLFDPERRGLADRVSGSRVVAA